MKKQTKQTKEKATQKMRSVIQKEFTYMTASYRFKTPTMRGGKGLEMVTRIAPPEKRTINVAVSNRAFSTTILFNSEETGWILNLGYGHGLFVSLGAQSPDSPYVNMFSSGFCHTTEQRIRIRNRVHKQLKKSLHLPEAVFEEIANFAGITNW